MRVGSGFALRACALGFALVLVLAMRHAAFAAPVSVDALDAQARAGGNRRDVAVAIGRALFTQTWPAQITKVRVDGIGSHLVAGVIVSGVKFHRAMRPQDLEDEALAIAARAFKASAVEEADVWATVPIDVKKGLPVSGDYAQPTARTVFAVSLERSERNAAGRVHAGTDVFWAPRFKAKLEGAR